MGNRSLFTSGFSALDAIATQLESLTKEFSTTADGATEVTPLPDHPVSIAVAKIGAQVAYVRTVLNGWNEALSNGADAIEKLDIEASEDDIKAVIVDIADILGARNPFLVDVSEAIQMLEEGFEALDNLIEGAKSAMSKFDDLLSQLGDYAEGYDRLTQEEVESLLMDADDLMGQSESMRDVAYDW